MRVHSGVLNRHRLWWREGSKAAAVVVVDYSIGLKHFLSDTDMNCGSGSQIASFTCRWKGWSYGQKLTICEKISGFDFGQWLWCNFCLEKISNSYCDDIARYISMMWTWGYVWIVVNPYEIFDTTTFVILTVVLRHLFF